MNYYQCPPVVHTNYPNPTVLVNLYPKRSSFAIKKRIYPLEKRAIREKQEVKVEKKEEEEKEEKNKDEQEKEAEEKEKTKEKNKKEEEETIDYNQLYKISTWREPGFGPIPANVNVTAVARSSDGSQITAVGNFDFIYISTDSGITWRMASNQPRPQQWISVSMSESGIEREAITINNTKYFSLDSGDTWAIHA